MTTFENEFEVHYFKRQCKCTGGRKYTMHRIYSLVGLRECLQCGRIKED